MYKIRIRKLLVGIVLIIFLTTAVSCGGKDSKTTLGTNPTMPPITDTVSPSGPVSTTENAKPEETVPPVTTPVPIPPLTTPEETTPPVTTPEENPEPVKLSLNDVYEEIDKLTLDSKGSAEGKLVTVEVTCTARVDSSLLFFNDAERIIKVHGIKDDKLWNLVRVGSTYSITGNIAVFKYQPEITNVVPEGITKSEIAPTTPAPKKVTGEAVSNLKYGDMTLYGYMLEVDGYFYTDNKDFSKEIFVISGETVKKHTASGRLFGLYAQNYDKYDLMNYFAETEIGEHITVNLTLYDTFRDHSQDFTRAYIFAK